MKIFWRICGNHILTLTSVLMVSPVSMHLFQDIAGHIAIHISSVCP